MEKHDHSRLTQPTAIGIGIWYTFHSTSAQARTRETKEHCIWLIKAIQAKFSCSICKEHMGQYLERHPPTDALDDDPESLFRWTWAFHNTVNSFNNKQQITYEEAKTLFWGADSVFCTAGCGSAEPEITAKPKLAK